jgi:hypothetical protein
MVIKTVGYVSTSAVFEIKTVSKDGGGSEVVNWDQNVTWEMVR